MNPEMMAVLSMRQKEMSYQHLAAAVASSTPTALAHASYLPPSQFAVDPALAVRSPVMAAPARVFGAPQPLAPSVPPPPAFFDAGAKDAMARACYSPLSVGHLPPQPALTANYDQYGFVWHWIAQASSHFALQRQTGHLAVCYAQRVLRQRLRAREEDPYFMGPYDDIYTVQKELQVLGLVCVFIAAKIEEVHPPKAADFGDFISEHGAVSCSADDVVRYEGQLLVELKWNLHPTTVLSWLLFLLAGDASDQPAETMRDFVSSTRVSSVRKDVFATAINLIDVALLDYQSMEFLPSVLAGSAILLADPGLDLGFVAQFLQLEPSLLWECKNWLYVATNGLNDSGRMTTRDNDRWGKVPTEELLFIQTEMPVPPHLAFGLLRSETTVYDYSPPVSNQSDNNTMYDNYPGYATQSCGSPSSCDSYGCYCQEGYPCASAAAPNVYHFKYGWQGSDMGYTSAPTVQRKLHFS